MAALRHLPMTASTAHVFARHPHLPMVELRTAHHSSACYWTHTHEEYSMGIIDAGHAQYSHGPHNSQIAAGTTVLIAPGLAHACNPGPGQAWSYRMMYLQTPWVLASLGLDGPGTTPAPPFTQPLLQSPTVFRRLDRFCKGIALVGNPLGLEEELLDIIGRYIQRTGPADPGAPSVTPALQRAKDLLMDRLEEVVTLDELAQVSQLSAYALLRKFKAAFGQTPHAFQLDQRINLSKRLLKQGMGLAEIAVQLGFADQAHFQRHFKQRHAISPLRYLRQ